MRDEEEHYIVVLVLQGGGAPVRDTALDIHILIYSYLHFTIVVCRRMARMNQ